MKVSIYLKLKILFGITSRDTKMTELRQFELITPKKTG